MLKIFKKHKVQEDKVSSIFVDYILSTIENGFPEVAALINESPEFVKRPDLKGTDSDRFLLISLAANLLAIQRHFPSHVDQTLSRIILEKIAEIGNVEYGALANSIRKNQAFISKVNHPSKNLVYGMSKAMFYKYNLNQFQDDYFKNVNSPNPVFLKRLDEAMALFMWDWEEL